MAAVGTVLSVAQTLFAALESSLLKEICSILGYKSELKNLKNTVTTVRAVLLDAEARHDSELSHAARDWIEKLKYAVYDADDLLDEFTTLAEQKQLLEGGTISKEVSAFFSRFNQLGVAYTMCRGIKKIRKQLDSIARDHAQFGLGLPNNEPIRRRNRETCSYVYEQNIIGRDDDKKTVIHMLLDPHVEANVSFVTIVGIGGLGKTALAQLVYNDEVIKKEFPLCMWVCVSDQDPKHLDIKTVLCKILESATQCKQSGGLGMDWVQHKVRNEIKGKRYLLVFDDVWIEDRDQCLKLGEFLMGGARGSRIVVTTRSKKTAKVIGSGSTHELQGLSDENSWHLFERLAFEQGQADLNPDLVEIGKQIVKKCANVPLAIRVVGTLLYGQNKAEWQAIQRKGLGKVRQDGNDILHVLKLSYYHLDTHLKSCFSFCAVYPKDFVLNKEKLIMLWMAQGCVKPLDGQSIYCAGEEYFSILVRRCFLQDVKMDKYGEIESCKMHDLMHDIAQEVAGDEICEAYAATSKINEKTRHVFHVKNDCGQSSLPRTKIRTCLKWESNESSSMDDIVRNWKYMRALDSGNRIEELPCAIGRLLHLRYLDLSWNIYLKRLPEEITKLHNLQTLLLKNCSKLKELPSNLSKLAKLGVLDIEGCDALRYMPCGLDKLTGLCILTLFVVGEVKSTRQVQGVGRLEDIEPLDELKGELTIKIHSNVKKNDKGGYLKKKEHLSWIKLRWLHDDEKNENMDVSDKVIAEELQPNLNLKELELYGYGDVAKPSWAIDDKLHTSLPNLVYLTIENCKGLEDLPILGRLRFLKSLYIRNLVNLEYMEKESSSSYGGYEANSGTRLFLSLEKFMLEKLPKLKGWWRGDAHMNDDDASNMQISFPHICDVYIYECPLLTSVPLCPSVEELRLRLFNERLEIMKIKSGRKRGSGAEDGHGDGEVMYMAASKLRKVNTDDLGYLKSLPMPTAFQFLSSMWIRGDKKVEDLREVEDVFRSCSSSLQHLGILHCRKLRSTSGALEHLTCLHYLNLHINNNIINDEMMRCRLEEEDEIPWSALQNCLHHLRINYLPKGVRHLTSLQILTLEDSSRIMTIPEWISCLSSLRSFQISNCSQELLQRCESPDGSDWHKIQHIPELNIH